MGGGVYGLAGAEGVPIEWLEGSPFADYRIPSWFLLVVVGGCLSWAAAVVLRGLPSARTWTLASGVLLLGWLAAQVAIIGYVSWMQAATACFALLLLLLAFGLPRDVRPKT